MFKLAHFLVAMSVVSSAAADVARLLNAADGFRLPSDALRVETEIRLYKSGTLDTERRYSVFLKPGRRSLVLMQSPSEKGQKVLMLADEFWQIMPQSQRPIRITPLQKLLGDAWAGDIATMPWGEDNTGTMEGEVSVEGVACLQLTLSAARKGVSYQRVDLYLAKADSPPVKADLYVASDKLAKRATFTVEDVGGRPQVSMMALSDEIQPGRQTVIGYFKRVSRSIPDEYYNPMYLTHNDLRD